MTETKPTQSSSDTCASIGSTVVANALWLYADQGLRAIMVLFTFGVVARHLGPEGYGALAFATAFPGVFLPFAKLGLDYVVVQELVRRPADAGRIMGTAASLMLVAGLLSLGAAFGAFGFVAQDNPARGLIGVTIWLLIAQPLLVFDFFFQSRVASRHTVIVRLITSLLINGCRLGFVFAGASLSWFAWLVAIEAVVLGVGLLLISRRSGAPSFSLWRDYNREEARLQLGASWPLLLAGVAMTGYLRLDQLMLSRLAGVGELGLYAAASRFADVGQLITYAMINSYFPRLVELHGTAGWMIAYQRFWRRITWLALGVAAAATVIAPFLLERLLGSVFSGAVAPLIILTWGNVFAAHIGVRGKWYLVEGWQKLSLCFFIGGAGLHLTGVWLLGARFGGVGTAISYVVAHAAMVLVFPLFLGKTRSSVRAAIRSFNPFSHDI